MERPCIDICTYDDATGWCRGCGMTKPERKAWKREPLLRGAILAGLAARLEALGTAGRVVGEAARKR